MFNAKKFVAEKTEELRNRIGSERVLAACSGGVDSTTTTCAVQKAVGRNLLAVFIDHGTVQSSPLTIGKEVSVRL